MPYKEQMAELQQGYNVTVTGRHVHVTPAMKEHAAERIARLERIGDRIIDVSVTMDIQKLEHRVDILMKYGHTVIRSHASSEDMYMSIDKAVVKLENQLKKYKNKLHNHYAKGHPIVEVPVSVWSVQEDAVESDGVAKVVSQADHPVAVHHSVVSHETRPLKILNEEEAIMKMELSGDQFMVYRSESDYHIKVIFRRTDGNYGIIQPEG